MDGERQLSELSLLLATAIGEVGAELLQRLVDRLGPLLADSQARRLPYTPEQLASVVLPRAEGLRPLPGPRVLHWCVTTYCPRQCAYCYAAPKLGSVAKDVLITRDQLEAIFAEAASLGAQTLLISGAEAFLREDLPEIMGDAIRQGIVPLVTTKHPISMKVAYRLADAGVRQISLSLDTLDGAQCQMLVGSAHYPDQVRRSIQHLRAAGVHFALQTVVTSLNRDALATVAAFALEEGAAALQFVPFFPVEAPIGTLGNAELALANLSRLREDVAALAGRFAPVRIELFEELSSDTQSEIRCDIGVTKLFFLPNGVVHRCYKLIDDRTLCGPDLRSVSVAAAWHDPRFGAMLHPPQEAYQGSACCNCRLFQDCHQTGRCIYAAKIRYGRYAAPDRECLPIQMGSNAPS